MTGRERDRTDIDWLSIDADTGAITIATPPDDEQIGSWLLTVTLGEEERDFSVIVSNVNDPPVEVSGFADIFRLTRDISAGDTLVAGSVFGGAFEDDDGDELAYSFSGS